MSQTLACSMLDGKWPFHYPPSLSTRVLSVFRGEYDFPQIPDLARPRRFLDIGANVGAFACWIFKRFSGEVFVDCYEPLPEAATLCERNMPPGGKVHRVAVTSKPGPVKLHVGTDWGYSSMDPAVGLHSGQTVEVPTLDPADLPPADGLKVDTEGEEIDILSRYRHLEGARIVMFEWHREKDRPVLEELCARAGLRLFKSAHNAVDTGIQVWIRSRAQNDHRAGRYVMPRP